MKDAFHCRSSGAKPIYGVLDSDHKLRMEAEYGSRRLLISLLRFGLKYGLPNLGTAQIRIRLQNAERHE